MYENDGTNIVYGKWNESELVKARGERGTPIGSRKDGNVPFAPFSSLVRSLDIENSSHDWNRLFLAPSAGRKKGREGACQRGREGGRGHGAISPTKVHLWQSLMRRWRRFLQHAAFHPSTLQQSGSRNHPYLPNRHHVAVFSEIISSVADLQYMVLRKDSS